MSRKGWPRLLLITYHSSLTTLFNLLVLPRLAEGVGDAVGVGAPFELREPEVEAFEVVVGRVVGVAPQEAEVVEQQQRARTLARGEPRVGGHAHQSARARLRLRRERGGERVALLGRDFEPRVLVEPRGVLRVVQPFERGAHVGPPAQLARERAQPRVEVALGLLEAGDEAAA